MMKTPWVFINLQHHSSSHSAQRWAPIQSFTSSCCRSSARLRLLHLRLYMEKIKFYHLNQNQLITCNWNVQRGKHRRQSNWTVTGSECDSFELFHVALGLLPWLNIFCSVFTYVNVSPLICQISRTWHHPFASHRSWTPSAYFWPFRQVFLAVSQEALIPNPPDIQVPAALLFFLEPFLFRVFWIFWAMLPHTSKPSSEQMVSNRLRPMCRVRGEHEESRMAKVTSGKRRTMEPGAWVSHSGGLDTYPRIPLKWMLVKGKPSKKRPWPVVPSEKP